MQAHLIKMRVISIRQVRTIKMQVMYVKRRSGPLLFLNKIGWLVRGSDINSCALKSYGSQKSVISRDNMCTYIPRFIVEGSR